MIECKEISYRYGRKMPEALHNVSASIGPGIYLLAGANGAGKTTLLHLLAGVASPNSGRCDIDGIPSSADSVRVKEKIFFVEEDAFIPAVSIYEFASRHACFYPNFSEKRLGENLDRFGLSGHERLKSLSLGNRKKSVLAYALALGVELLLLDEPCNGLDIQGKEALRSMLAVETEEWQTIIVATHTPADLDTLFDGALFLKQSNLLTACRTDDITDRLAFVTARNASVPFLYSEINIGVKCGIVPVGPESTSTRVDWKMLYNALHSDAAPQILSILNEIFEK